MGGGHVRLQGKIDDQSLSNNNRNRVKTTSLKLFRLDIFECFEWEEKNRTTNKIEKQLRYKDGNFLVYKEEIVNLDMELDKSS